MFSTIHKFHPLQVEKRVEVPAVELQERIVEVPQTEVAENPVPWFGGSEAARRGFHQRNMIYPPVIDRKMVV